MKRLLIIISLAATIFTGARGEVNLGFPDEEAAFVGVYVKDLSTGRVLAENNSKKAFIPASTMKLVTSATALNVLGEEFRFSTDCMLVGNRRDNDTWHGDLVVRASADPTLESENFPENRGFCDSIASELERAGIKRITGQILVDDGMSDYGANPEWLINDVAYAYGAGLFGFNYRDNILKVWPVTGDTEPFTPDLDIHLAYSAEGTDFLRGARSSDLYVYGKNLADQTWSLNTTMPRPSVVFTEQLADMLRTRGIDLEMQYDENDVAADTLLLYSHQSPALVDMLTSLMVRSDNLFAEGMLRALAPDGTRSDALKVEKAFWEELGLDPHTAQIVDGSGLSRKDRLTPRFLGDVLEFMAKSDKADTYASFFPKAGKDGTMKSFLAKKRVSGTMAFKTGSMNGIQCYAGYRLDAKGHPTHVVVVLVNSMFGRRADVRASVERLMIKLFPVR